MTPASLDLLRHLLLFVLLVFAVYSDLAHGRVDNLCAYTGILGGLLIHGLAGGWGSGSFLACLQNARELGLMNALLGGGAAFAVFLPFFCVGGFGGGDLKLMTAVGTLCGLYVTLTALVLVATVGAAMAFGLLIWKGRLIEGLRGTWGILRRFGRPALPLAGEGAPAARLAIRYVPAIAAGTTWAWYLRHV